MTPPTRRPAFITPLRREDLFDPGVVFPREELVRRVLSFFWRDCCCPTCFSRAPAPVVELSGETAAAGTSPRAVRAWWLLDDGIIEEHEGPNSERLRPFFGGVGRTGQMWPRYAFRVRPDVAEIEMTFYREPLRAQSQRLRFAAGTGGEVRIIGHEVSWNM